MVIIARAFLDIDNLDLLPLTATAACIGLSVCLLLQMIDRKVTLIMTIFGGLFSVAVFAGVLMHVNSFFDARQPDIYPVKVITASHHTRFVTVSAWGERRAPDSVEVSGGLQRHLKTGDTICIYLFRGYLGWRWYYADKCPAAKPT